MTIPFYKKLLAEAFGTFWLVFLGTAAVVVQDATGAIGSAGVAVVPGLMVFILIWTLGDVSGAHLNPAVTVGFYLARRLKGRVVVPYVASQTAGAVLASVVLAFLFPAHATLGTISPLLPPWHAWFLEVLLSAAFMFVVLSVTTGAVEKGMTAAMVIGSMVALEVLVAGSVSGAATNPARSLAPALVSGNMQALWIYLSAPFVGVALAVVFCVGIRGKST